MNFGLLFKGAIIFDTRYLADYLSEHDEIWQCWGSGQSTLIPPHLVNFGLLFGEHKFSTVDMSTLFVGAGRNLAVLGVWPIKTYCLHVVKFGLGSHDTMRRHAPVLH